MEPQAHPSIFGDEIRPPLFTQRRGFSVNDLLNSNEPSTTQSSSGSHPSHSGSEQLTQHPTWFNEEVAAREESRQMQITSWAELYDEEPWAMSATNPQLQLHPHPYPQSLAHGPADPWRQMRDFAEFSDGPSTIPRNHSDWNRDRLTLPTLQQPADASTPIQLPSVLVPKSRKRSSCIICMDSFGADTTVDNFLHKCGRCQSGNICTNCLRSWFLDACKNESKMPPKCCRIIPLSTVSTLLSAEEIELYKAKFEEWNTTDRIYCPVPICSAFVPPKLYSKPQISSQYFEQYDSPFHFQGVIQGANYDPTISETKGNGRQSTSQSFNPNVLCPNCQTNICTGCRSHWHFGECPLTDLDPELEANLKRWKIQRCPKCRAGVRKIYGCSHVECRCGAHFCWECRQPISMCTGCEDSDEEREVPSDEFDEDDLDGRAGYFEGDGHEFGPEPYGVPVDHWACPGHVWSAAVREGERNHAECHRCFRNVKFFDSTQHIAVREEDIPMAGYTTEPGWPTNIFGEPAWQCVEGHLRCERCPKIAPPDRQGETPWEIRCGCGMECEDCARNKKEKEREMAWECRCGMIVCGDCKELLPEVAHNIRGRNEAVGGFRYR